MEDGSGGRRLNLALLGQQGFVMIAARRTVDEFEKRAAAQFARLRHLTDQDVGDVAQGATRLRARPGFATVARHLDEEAMVAFFFMIALML